MKENHCKNCYYEPKNRGLRPGQVGTLCLHRDALQDIGNNAPCKYFVPNDGIELEWYCKGWDDAVRNNRRSYI